MLISEAPSNAYSMLRKYYVPTSDVSFARKHYHIAHASQSTSGTDDIQLVARRRLLLLCLPVFSIFVFTVFWCEGISIIEQLLNAHWERCNKIEMFLICNKHRERWSVPCPSSKSLLFQKFNYAQAKHNEPPRSRISNVKRSMVILIQR